MSDKKSDKLNFHNLLPYLIFGGVVLGIIIGGALPDIGKELAFIGDMFMRSLLMLVVPLVMTSIIVGISQLGDVRKLGGLARKTILYFLSTTFLAASLGLVLVNIIQPGVTPDVKSKVVKKEVKKQVKETSAKDIPASEIAKENAEKLEKEMLEEAAESEKGKKLEADIERKTPSIVQVFKRHHCGSDTKESF